LVQQYTFPPIFMQKFEKSTPGLLEKQAYGELKEGACKQMGD